MSKEQTLEEAFGSLDEIIEKMEDSELSLDESFTLYSKGIELLKFCNEKIEKIETDIKLVTENTQNQL